MSRTPSNITVKVLDLSAPARRALEYVSTHPDVLMRACAPSEVAPAHKYGIVDTPRGIFALTSEGVGPSGPVTDENPLRAEFHSRFPAGTVLSAKELFGPASGVSMDFGPDRLRELATAGEVQLEDFIRSFGARLDRNYELWRSILTQQGAGQEVAT